MCQALDWCWEDKKVWVAHFLPSRVHDLPRPSNKQIIVANTAWQTLQLEDLQHRAQCLGPRRCTYWLGLPSAVSNKQSSHSINSLHKWGVYFSYCGRLNDDPQRCLHPNPWNLSICSLKWQKGLCRCDQGSWDGRLFWITLRSPVYPDAASYSQGSLKREAEESEGRRWCDDRGRDWSEACCRRRKGLEPRNTGGH